MDPDFMAKLQRLGPVSIDDPGKIVRTVSLQVELWLLRAPKLTCSLSVLSAL